MHTEAEVHEPIVPEPELQEHRAARQRRETAPAAPPVKVESLFVDVLLEPRDRQRRGRALATTISFALQCLLVAVLLVVPLMYTDELPTAQLVTFLVGPPAPPPPPPAAAATEVKPRVIRRVESDVTANGQLRTPSRVPKKVLMIREEEPPPPLAAVAGGIVGGVPGGIPGGQLGGVIGGIISSTAKPAVVPKLAVPSVPKRIRISQGVTKGQLIQLIQPTYPLLAKQARIQGQVLLKAIIDKNGDIRELQVISGHPMLVPAALEAVKQWHYRPFLLNGGPVEVETQITVTFRLSS